MPSVSAIDGDITQVYSEGLLTAINSEGTWYGGVDFAIKRLAGQMFHDQAARRMPLSDGQTIYTPALEDFSGQFRSVIFIVDDRLQPLRNLVVAGLNEAEKRRLANVTLPTIRTGVMAGSYEATIEAALDEMVLGIRQFIAKGPEAVQSITVVVYNDPSSTKYLSSALAS